MPDYNKTAQNALKLIEKNGKRYTFTRSVTTVDEVTGESTGETSQTTELAAVILPHYKGIAQSSMDDTMREQLIRGHLRTVLAAAAGAAFSPDALDVVEIEEANWRVIGCTPLSPAGIPLIFTIGVAKV